MGPAGGDRVVADVVALDPGSEVEDALHHPLPLLHGLGKGSHHVLEAADRRRHRPLQHPDLVVVLHQAELAELAGQPRLLGGRLRSDDQGVHRRIEPAQHQHRAVQAAHRLAKTVERCAGDAEQMGRLLHPAPGADPHSPVLALVKKAGEERSERGSR